MLQIREVISEQSHVGTAPVKQLLSRWYVYISHGHELTIWKQTHLSIAVLSTYVIREILTMKCMDFSSRTDCRHDQFSLIAKYL